MWSDTNQYDNNDSSVLRWKSWNLPSEDQVRCVARAEAPETESSPRWCASYRWHWWPYGAFHHLEDRGDTWKWLILKAGDSLWVREATSTVVKSEKHSLCLKRASVKTHKITKKSLLLCNELYLFRWRARRTPAPCLGSCARRSVCSARCVSAAGERCGSRCPSGNGPWQSWALCQACAKTTGYPFAWRGWSHTVGSKLEMKNDSLLIQVE